MKKNTDRINYYHTAKYHLPDTNPSHTSLSNQSVTEGNELSKFPFPATNCQ